jgi:hypothetical protein
MLVTLIWSLLMSYLSPQCVVLVACTYYPTVKAYPLKPPINWLQVAGGLVYKDRLLSMHLHLECASKHTKTTQRRNDPKKTKTKRE